MIGTNKRRQLRIGTNLIGNVISVDNQNSIIFIENISCIGAKIKSSDRHLNINETLKINFRYKNTLYDLLCKVVREDNSSTYGIEFYFQDNSNNISNIKNKLHLDILDEFFISQRSC